MNTRRGDTDAYVGFLGWLLGQFATITNIRNQLGTVSRKLGTNDVCGGPADPLISPFGPIFGRWSPLMMLIMDMCVRAQVILGFFRFCWLIAIVRFPEFLEMYFLGSWVCFSFKCRCALLKSTIHQNLWKWLVIKSFHYVWCVFHAWVDGKI
jgi:hypothetical protein